MVDMLESIVTFLTFIWIQVYFKCQFQIYILSLTQSCATAFSLSFFLSSPQNKINKNINIYLRMDCLLHIDSYSGKFSVEISISDYCHEHMTLNLILLHFVYCVQLIGCVRCAHYKLANQWWPFCATRALLSN